MTPTEAKPPPPRSPARAPRWGLRTLGFLLLGVVAVFTAQALGRHTAGTLGSLVLALAGAAYCSLMGVRGTPGRFSDVMRSRAPGR